MNKHTKTFVGIACAVAASAMLVASLSLPIWNMRMEAPQYQGKEALKVSVYPGKLTGDLGEIANIQQYVGIRIPTALPELQWLPKIIVGAAFVGFIAAFLPMVVRRRALLATAAGLCLAMVAAAGLAQWQMYKVGHERTHSPLAGVPSFTAPVLGDLKFANFHIKSRLGWGSFLIGGAVLLQIAGARVSARAKKSAEADRPVVINPHPSFQRTIPANARSSAKVVNTSL